MKKNSFPFLSVAVLSVIALVSCGGTANNAKPLIFFNRQPSDPTTSAVDMDTMNFSDKTYYVGFDAAAGGDVQGKMITDFLKTKTKAELDKNGDGTLGYVLCIGDAAHNDSKARTLGIRKALGTAKDDSTAADDKKDGSVNVKDGTLVVKELAAKVMTGADGSTWNADAAKDATTAWVSKLGAGIDMFVSNNDGMAEGCLSNPSFPNVPIFGYDANADAVADIGTGKMTGTVSQNVDAQAAGTLQMIRNICDGLTGEDVYKKGFTENDQYGNKISASMAYISSTKAVLASNTAVTAANYTNYTSGSRDTGIAQLTSSAKTLKVWIDLYNASDNFLSSSYKPALEYYAGKMNINLSFTLGDGSSENSVSDYFVNLDNFDAFAVNMVKTNSGSLYTGKII